MLRALLLATLALSACRNTEVSPGRERALGHSFRCAGTDGIPDRVRALFGAEHIPLRETGDARSVWIAAGVRGGSEYAVQIVGPDATVALYVRRGGSPTPDEQALFNRLSGLFASCERQPDPIR